LARFFKNRQDNSDKSKTAGAGAQAPRTAADAGSQSSGTAADAGSQSAAGSETGGPGAATGGFGELIAVFAAAIAQFEGADAKPFRVVSYRRTSQTSPVWNLRGRSEYLSGKL
jgi:hypothetical protein